MSASQARIAHVLLAVAGVLLAGCTSTPFESASDFDRTFIGASQTWDLDKNGIVACDEWKQYVSGSLRDADANGDGALDAQEFRAMARTDRLFDVADLTHYDVNSDGRVTLDELTGKPNRAFTLLDKNGDCQIDRTEAVQVVGTGKLKEKEKEVDQRIPNPGGGGY